MQHCVGRGVSFNTQPPEGGWIRLWLLSASGIGFNTQPPEGGWLLLWRLQMRQRRFNTQPPEGGWVLNAVIIAWLQVSTHSRPKAAGPSHTNRCRQNYVSTHSRPKAAGLPAAYNHNYTDVSTHSRPKAAGPFFWRLKDGWCCFNAQPPEGGGPTQVEPLVGRRQVFAHRGARRRLEAHVADFVVILCFNTQPPEGGWACR